MMKIEKLSKIQKSLIIHTLIMIFGISAWLGINGIFVQLPLIISTAPEQWSLPIYLVIMIQLANIGPITFTLSKKFLKNYESACIIVVLSIGALSMGLLAFTYDIIHEIGGNQHSLMLYIFVFFNAIVGCTSSVLFMPYLRSFSVNYLVSYFIGEGLSGVIPSIIALVQGTRISCSIHPLFSPRFFFFILFGILLLCLITFILLNLGNTVADDNKFDVNVEINCSTVVDDKLIDKLTKFNLIYLHILIGFVCFMGNGYLPGIQSFSCMRYGRTAYHLAVTLANIANPLACFVYSRIKCKSFKIIQILAGFSIVLGGFVTSVAVVSEPPIPGNFGIFLIIISWILIMGIISYVKVGIASVVKVNEKNALFSVGGVMQIGSACGAILAFVLINFTGWFVGEEEECV